MSGWRRRRATRQMATLDRIVSLYRETTGALFVSALLSLIPGIFLAYYTGVFLAIPGLLILIPPLIGMRGNIYGALSARLSTGLHIGTISAGDSSRGVLSAHIRLSMLEALTLSYILPVVVYYISPFMGIRPAPLSQLLFITILGALITGVIMVFSTIWLVFTSFRKGINPDNIAPAIITSIGDLVTLPVFIGSAMISLAVPRSAMYALIAGGLAYVAYLLVTSVKSLSREFAEMISERIPVLLFCMALSGTAGYVLEGNLEGVLAGTVFLLLVPMVNGQGGNVGSIFASRTSTMFYIGDIKLGKNPDRHLVADGAVLVLSLLTLFTLISAGAAVYTESSFTLLISVMVPVSVLIATVAVSVAYYITVLTVRMNLDPDNISIPVVSAFMDMVGSGFFVLAIVLVT